MIEEDASISLERTFESLSDEEKEQAKETPSMEEIEEVADSGGMRLSVDDLDAVSGGVSRHCRTKCRDDE